MARATRLSQVRLKARVSTAAEWEHPHHTLRGIQMERRTYLKTMLAGSLGIPAATHEALPRSTPATQTNEG